MAFLKFKKIRVGKVIFCIDTCQDSILLTCSSISFSINISSKNVDGRTIIYPLSNKTKLAFRLFQSREVTRKRTKEELKNTVVN